MDVLYEESSVAKNAKKSEQKYAILHVLSNIFLVLMILTAIPTLLFIPEWGLVLFFGSFALTFFGFWFILYRWKNTTNVSYDYFLVSDEIRIAKVINTSKRKLVARFDGECIIQIGDVDAPSFERFKADPNVKTVICTSNSEASEGKFFMYILAEYEGRKLFILECREELLINILKFTKRTALDRDYVSQEKKKQQV